MIRHRLRRLAALCMVSGRFLRILQRDSKTPRWARWGIVAALLPVPGPFDEIVGAAVVAGLLIRHRGVVEMAWAEAHR